MITAACRDLARAIALPTSESAGWVVSTFTSLRTDDKSNLCCRSLSGRMFSLLRSNTSLLVFSNVELSVKTFALPGFAVGYLRSESMCR